MFRKDANSADQTESKTNTPALSNALPINENQPGSEEALYLKKLKARSEKLTAETRKALSTLSARVKAEREALAKYKQQINLLSKINSRSSTNHHTLRISANLGKKIIAGCETLNKNSAASNDLFIQIFSDCFDKHLIKNIEETLALLKSFQPGSSPTINETHLQIKENLCNFVKEISMPVINTQAIKTHLLLLNETLLKMSESEEIKEIDENQKIQNAFQGIIERFSKVIHNIESIKKTSDPEEKQATASPRAK